MEKMPAFYENQLIVCIPYFREKRYGKEYHHLEKIYIFTNQVTKVSRSKQMLMEFWEI